MGEPANINWIQKTLTQLKLYRRSGAYIDVNKNGRRDRKDIRVKSYNGNRFPGYNRKVVGDWTDWLALYSWNSRKLSKLGGIFNWAGKLKSTNPLHQISVLESYLSKRDNILITYKKVVSAVQNLKMSVDQSNTPRVKLTAIFDAMISVGLLRKRRYPLVTEEVTRTPLNPVATAFIAVSIAHELGWPVHVVRAPKHVFIRWDKGRVRVNADWYVKKLDSKRKDIFPTDKDYMRYFKITPRMVKKGVYLRTLKRKGLTALILRMRGEARYRRGDLSGAEKDLANALKIDSPYVRAWNILGIIKGDIAEIEGNRGKSLEAVKAFTKALSYNPSYTDALNNCGNVYLDSLEMPKKAVAYFNKALAIKPTYSAARYNLGRAQFKLMKYAEARKSLEATLADRSWSPHLHNHLGLVYEELKMPAKAIKSFKKAIKLGSSSKQKAQFSFNLASLYHRRKKYPLAAKHYSKAIKHDQSNSVAWFKLGTIAEAMGKHAEALKYYGKAIRLAKRRYARAYLRRAAVHVKLRNYQSAAMDLHTAKRLDEDLVDPLLIKTVINKSRQRK